MEQASPAIVLCTDADGHVVKRACAARISPRWREAVDSTVAAYAAHLGGALHSVYVRGSVPLGTARDLVSDVDTFAIVARAVRPSDVSWAPLHMKEVARRWPFVAGVEVSAYPLFAATARRRVAAMIKVHGACVHGPDLSSRIRGFRPGVELVFHGWDLPRDLAFAKGLLATAEEQAVVDETCVWAMKRIVRSGFELVMERARCVTRDLVACYEIFAGYYPGEAVLMEEALALALAGGGDRERCRRAIENVERWLYQEICSEYGAARIAELMASGARYAVSAPRSRPDVRWQGR